MKTTKQLRSRIMKRAYAIKREYGYAFGAAQKLAWLEAREGLLPCVAQPGGVRAACRRYGVPVDVLEARALAFVRDVAHRGQKALTALQHAAARHGLESFTGAPMGAMISIDRPRDMQ